MRRKRGGNAIKTNGYASKLESRVADSLRAQLDDDEELEEQVPIKFACGAVYICDFAVKYNGRRVLYVEAKGKVTPVWRLKMRMLKHEHPHIAEKLLVSTYNGDYMLLDGPKRKVRKAKSCKKKAKSKQSRTSSASSLTGSQS